MKYSMRTKVFALCLFLVVVTVGSLSTTSYYTTKKLIHDSVEKRIQVAFDIILNDLFYQIENFPRQIDEFLKQDNSLKRALYVYGKTPEKIGSILYVTGHLIRATNELKKVGNVVSINRLGLYSKDGRLLVFHGNFEKGQHMGAHVKSFNGKDTFLPLNDRSAMAEMKKLRSSQTV